MTRPSAVAPRPGTPQSNASAPAVDPLAAAAPTPAVNRLPSVPTVVLRGLGDGRGPPVETRIDWPVNVTSTVPSVSVR